MGLKFYFGYIVAYYIVAYWIVMYSSPGCCFREGCECSRGWRLVGVFLSEDLSHESRD